MAASIKEFIHIYPGTSKAFTVSASVGDVIILGVTTNGAASHATASDDKGNTYTEKAFQQNSANGNVTVLTAPVTTGGTITVSTNALSDAGFSAYLVSGLTGITKDVQTATGTANPLTVSLTFSVVCSVFCFWGNESSNDYASFTLSFTESNHDNGHYDAAGYKLDVASGTYASGINSNTGQIGNTVIAIAMENTGAASFIASSAYQNGKAIGSGVF